MVDIDTNKKENQKFNQNMTVNQKAPGLTFISLGGMGIVTRNMHLYIVDNEILIVDCGIGFPDQSTVPGVDFLIPDISYLKKLVDEGKKIVGMILSHGHEDHIGAVPFLLDQLPQFPIFGTRFTAALTNVKLKDFALNKRVDEVDFNKDVKLGNFTFRLIRVTHSVPDTSHIFMKTPVGNFYHGCDYKFDLAPVDKKPSDLQAIVAAGNEGITALFSDCLGSEREGHSESESKITGNFEDEFRRAKGKVFITTYSSNVARMNQAVEAAIKFNRKICFMGRSFLKVRDLSRQLGYLNCPEKWEVKPERVASMNPKEVMILLPGSQAQEESALVRVATDSNRYGIRVEKEDTVIFSADPIPGNEVSIYALLDVLSQKGARIIYSDIANDFHVSGHGSQNDIKLLTSLLKPKFVIPISGNYRHMNAYSQLMRELSYDEKNVILVESGQEIFFSGSNYRVGKRQDLKTVYVDEFTGDELEHFVLRDRQKISKEGVMIILAEVDTNSGKLVTPPDIIARGFLYPDKDEFSKKLVAQLSKVLSEGKGKATNWGYYRKVIQRSAERLLMREKREPMVIPIIVEV